MKDLQEEIKGAASRGYMKGMPAHKTFDAGLVEAIASEVMRTLDDRCVQQLKEKEEVEALVDSKLTLAIEIRDIINKRGWDSLLDTPDYVLAAFLVGQLYLLRDAATGKNDRCCGLLEAL